LLPTISKNKPSSERLLSKRLEYFHQRYNSQLQKFIFEEHNGKT